MFKFKKLFILSILGLPMMIAPISQISSESNVIRVLSATENHEVFIGDIINVQTRRLEYEGQSKDVQGVIHYPSGSTFVGRQFTVSEPGLHKIVYTAFFGHHKEEQIINYLCKRKSENFFTITNPVDISYGEYRYNTKSYYHEGVIIDVKSGTEILFNEPLSVEDFMVEQEVPANRGFRDRHDKQTAHSLINFLVDPNNYLSTDFTSMAIRLTDSVDKSNYVEIRIDDGYYSEDARSGSMSFVRAGASCNWQLGWGWEEIEGKINQGHFNNGRGGSGLNLSFRGQPYSDNIVGAQILYSATNQRLYNCLGSLETNFIYFINDLDDPTVYGKNVWGGFTSGKFYLSIIPMSFSSVTGRLLIKSVGRYQLNSEILVDDEAPVIHIDTKGYGDKDGPLPRAILGRRYPIFDAYVTDNYDSDLTYDVSVTHSGKDVNVSNGSFLANKSGIYIIKYQAQDRSGNVADVITKKIMTVDTYDEVNLSLATSETTVNAYDLVNIPTVNDVECNGGVENTKIELERKLVNPKGQEVVLTGDEFRPTLVGDYKVIFTGTDYIGNTGEVTYTIHVQELSAPIFIEEPNLPPALIKGYKYTFDNITAIETLNGEISELTPSILINGEDYTGEWTATGTSATITYKAVGNASTSLLNKDIDVVDVSNGEGGYDHTKYFAGDYTATKGRIGDNDNVTLSGSLAGYSKFIKALNPDNFYIEMRLIDDKTNMGIISVRLTDSKNKDLHVTFDISYDKENNAAKISVPNLTDLSFAIKEDEIALTFAANDSRSFTDTLQNVVGSIVYYDNGEEFNGFKNGVYLEVGFKEVSGQCAIAIEKICNQAIGKAKDRVDPTIRYNSLIQSEQQEGDMFVYPTFEAFDVTGDIVETSITITKPNGEKLIGDKNMTESFLIESTGDYYVVYIAKDSSDNMAEVDEVISIYDDAKPTIVVNNPPASSYAYNSAFKIPTYTASDDSGKYTVDVILIMPTNEMRILTHHVHDEDGYEVDYIEYALDKELELYDPNFIIDKTTCRLNMRGAYRLRFVAYDNAFNTTVVEYSFNVK